MMDKKIEIYYDGTCRICTAGVESVASSSRGNSFEKRNIHEVFLPRGISSSEASREIHVVDEKGEVHKGAAGALRILEEYSRWRWLVRLAKLPFVYPFVSLGYKLVAANRHRFN
jgi:predicted DCC family thiol-disulfide oxidoreductase YuxK